MRERDQISIALMTRRLFGVLPGRTQGLVRFLTWRRREHFITDRFCSVLRLTSSSPGADRRV